MQFDGKSEIRRSKARPTIKAISILTIASLARLGVCCLAGQIAAVGIAMMIALQGFSPTRPDSEIVEGSDSPWSRKMACRCPTSADCRRNNALRQPLKDCRQTQTTDCQAEILCQMVTGAILFLTTTDSEISKRNVNYTLTQ